MSRKSALVTLALAIISALLISPTAQATEGSSAATRGAISWHSCPAEFTGWKCGTLTVPLDWDDLGNPANASIQIVVKRASGKRLGHYTFNPGGPGGSGIELARDLYALLPPQMRQRFDFVAWDPRGVGASMPQLSGCEAPAFDYDLPATGAVDWAAYVESYAATWSTTMQSCYERNLDVAPYLGTYYVIRDLEAMRTALGVSKWNFWAASYGTRIGYRYAQEFPNSLRTLVLDGSWSPNMTVRQWMYGATRSFTTAQAVFSSLFGKNMEVRLQRVVDGLDRQTITVDDETLTRWELMPAIFANISDQDSYPQILQVITLVDRALQEGSVSPALGKPLRTLRKRAAEQDISAAFNLFFINCRDLVGYPSVAEVTRAASVSAATNSVWAADATITKGTACMGLPDDFTKGYVPLTTPLTLTTPPVVVGALGDTRTEYDMSRTMANSLAGSSLITYDGTQHVSYTRIPSACINRAVTRYFLTRAQPGTLLCPYAPTPIKK